MSEEKVKVSRSKSGREVFVRHKRKDGKETVVVYSKGQKYGNPKVLEDKKK